MPRLLLEKVVEVLRKKPSGVGNAVPEMQCTYGQTESVYSGSIYQLVQAFLNYPSTAPWPLDTLQKLQIPAPYAKQSVDLPGRQVRKRMPVGAALPRDHESDTALAALWHHQGKSHELSWRGTGIITKNSPKADCTYAFPSSTTALYSPPQIMAPEGWNRKKTQISRLEGEWERRNLKEQIFFSCD